MDFERNKKAHGDGHWFKLRLAFFYMDACWNEFELCFRSCAATKSSDNIIFAFHESMENLL